MSDYLVVELGYMPWSTSRPTWSHHCPGALETIAQALDGRTGRLMLQLRPQRNKNLRGLLQVDATRFKFVLEVVHGGAPPEAAVPPPEAFTVFAKTYPMRFEQDEEGNVGVTLEMPFPPDCDKMRFLLAAGSDVQTVAILLLAEYFGLATPHPIPD